MTQLTDFCLRCPCEPNSKECWINNTVLNENGTYQCKMLRYQRNQNKVNTLNFLKVATD